MRFCRIDARAPDLDGCGGSTREMRARRRGRVAAHRRRALPRPELERPGRPPGRDRRRVARRARRALRGASTSGSTARGSSPARPSTSARCGSSRSGRNAASRSLGARAGPSPRRRATRRADFGDGPVEAPVRSRATLARADAAGPLLVDEYDTTVVVPPGWTVRLDDATRRARARPRRASTAARAATTTRSRMRLVGTRSRPLADEMATTVFRTAHSAVVRDAMDFSAALCAPDRRDRRAGGDDPAAARLDPERDADAARELRRRVRARATSTSSTTRSTARATRRTSSSSSRRSRTATLIGFAVTVAHHGDVGGRVPGTIACDSTEVFQEGLRLPWLQARRPRRAGRGAVRDPARERAHPARAARRPRRAGRRVPHRRPRAAGARGAATRRLDGADGRAPRPHGAAAPRRDRALAGRRRRSSSTTWTPTGSTSATSRSRVRLTVRGDELVADFSESAPMVRGSLNCTPSFVEAAVYHCRHGGLGDRHPADRRRAAADHGRDEAGHGHARR